MSKLKEHCENKTEFHLIINVISIFTAVAAPTLAIITFIGLAWNGGPMEGKVSTVAIVCDIHNFESCYLTLSTISLA